MARSTAKPMTESKKSTFLPHVSRSSPLGIGVGVRVVVVVVPVRIVLLDVIFTAFAEDTLSDKSLLKKTNNL